MTKIDFDNAIKYNNESIKEFDGIFTVNLSKCLYSSFKNKPFTKNLFKVFDISKIINSDLCVRIITKERKSIVVIQPEIQELLKVFGNNYKKMIFDDFKDAYSHKKNIEKEIRVTFRKIFSFLADRHNILNGHYFLKTKFLTEENENELKNLILEVNEWFSTQTKIFIDYNYDICYENIDIRESEIDLSYIYNFRTLRDFFKELTLQTTEFYSAEKFLKSVLEEKEILQDEYNIGFDIFVDLRLYEIETQIEKINEVINKINETQICRKEIFALICLVLEDYVDKETKINNFIEKIMTDSLSYVEVDKDLNVSVINK